MILFFISRHILMQMHGTLNVVEQSETELINEKNMLIRSMAHDIRTPPLFKCPVKIAQIVKSDRQ